MIKKLSIMLAALLLLSVVNPVWAGNVTEELTYYADVITKMGIMELENSTDFMGEEFIDREQAVKYVLGLMNVTGYSETDKIYFKDVSRYSEGFQMISTAVSLGIIKGDGNGNFRPDDNVTGQEAVIMLLRAMNYEVMTLNGANTYDALARKYGLLNGVTYEGGYINRNNFARMLYNTFDMGIAEQIAFGSSEEYSVSKEKSALSFRKLKKAEGVVSASGISSIYYSAKNLPGYGIVTVGGYNYTAGTTAVSSYLGYNVEIFYEDTEEENPLILYAFRKNNEEKVYPFKVNGYSAENGDLVSVDQSGKTTKINITPEACMIVNGEAVEYNLDYIVNCGNTGDFTLVSNSGGSDAEVIFINSLRNDVVASIDADNGYIYLKNGTYNGKPYIELPIEEEQYSITVTREGREIEFGSLAAGEAISYGISSSGLVVNIIASGISVTGVVNGLRNEDEAFVTIGEEELALASDCYVETGIELATTVTALVNAYGRIISISTGVTKNYAAVLAAKQGTGFEADSYVRFFIYPGNAADYVLAEKVTVNGGDYTENGSRYIPHDSLINMLNETKAYSIGEGEYKYTSLVTYELDKDGKISNIDFEQSPSGDAVADSEKLIHYHTVTAKYSVYSGITLDGIILRDSPVFRIPTVENKTDVIDEVDCSIKGLTRSTNYTDSQKIKMYDVGYNGAAGAVVMNEASTGFRNKVLNAYVFKRMVNAADKGGSSVRKIYYSYNGSEASVLVSSDAVNVGEAGSKKLEELEFGDIFTFEVSNDGYMDKFLVYYSYNENPDFSGVIAATGDGAGNNRELLIMKGIARYNNNGDITLEYDNAGNKGFELLTEFNGIAVTVADTGSKAIRYENSGRINFTNFANGTDGDEIIIIASRNALTEVICYE